MTGSAASPPRVSITSLGCKVNFAEMSELAGALAAAGCEVVPEGEHADVHVLNSCTVTMQADATTRQRMRRLRRANPSAYTVLTGCSVDANPDLYPAGTSDAAAVDGIDAVFANGSKQAIADHVIGRFQARLRGAPARPATLRSRAFLKVQDGCAHRCTYCIVWQARGRSSSRGLDDVLAAAELAAASGHGELVLCGVDLGSYGRGHGTSLARLVERLLDHVGDRSRIRLSSVNANDLTPALIALNAHPRLCSHWHMPLQSGSDSVLRAMHRGYRRAQYLRVVEELRARDPLTEFTTDVMVAFPGETEEDHAQTLSLIEAVGFHSCHVFRWSPRPGTPATAYPDRVDDATARRRSLDVRRAAARTGDASRRRAIGRVHEVVWEAPGRALSASYHEILVDVVAARRGALAHVLAERVEGDALRGTLVNP